MRLTSLAPVVIGAAFCLSVIPALALAQSPAPPVCGGVLKQGGLVVCQAEPGTRFKVAGPSGENARTVESEADGLFTIGLRQHESSVLKLSPLGSDYAPMTLNIAPRKDDYREITGLDCDKVDARTEAQKSHASRSWVKKQDAFARFNAGPGAANGCRWPDLLTVRTDPQIYRCRWRRKTLRQHLGSSGL